MTREPGDLPALGRSCRDPGDGHGTVNFRLSDERAVEAASVRVSAPWGAVSMRAPTVRTDASPNVASPEGNAMTAFRDLLSAAISGGAMARAFAGNPADA
jgi:hypothetical protein